jgi:serine/threonine protein kinase
MPLSIGDQLGHYKIQSMIVKGGMGEVYQALDTKLDRDVAIKVLSAALSGDPERLSRFEREAKVLFQLNHPGIASIYGVEERAGGFHHKACAISRAGRTLERRHPKDRRDWRLGARNAQ